MSEIPGDQDWIEADANAKYAALTGTEPKLSPASQLSHMLTSLDWQKIDAEKAKILLDVQLRVLDRQAKEAFDRAFVAMQPELPEIDKNGAIVIKGVIRSRYSLFEDIMAAIAGPLAKYGFGITFNTPDTGDLKSYKITCKLKHQDGHSEPYELRLPIDISEFRSAVQNSSSTISAGKRILLKEALNLVERGEDIPPELGFITADQVKDLETMILDSGADKKRFLRHFKLDRLEQMSKQDHKEAVRMLNDKLGLKRARDAAK
jgi:hypothetical protein